MRFVRSLRTTLQASGRDEEGGPEGELESFLEAMGQRLSVLALFLCALTVSRRGQCY